MCSWDRRVALGISSPCLTRLLALMEKSEVDISNYSEFLERARSQVTTLGRQAKTEIEDSGTITAKLKEDFEKNTEHMEMSASSPWYRAYERQSDAVRKIINSNALKDSILTPF